MIYGDMFSSDTRALIAICKHAEILYNYQEVNTLKKENFSNEYATLNPTKQIPMIVDGHKQVVGAAGVLHAWVLETRERASSIF